MVNGGRFSDSHLAYASFQDVYDIVDEVRVGLNNKFDQL